MYVLCSTYVHVSHSLAHIVDVIHHALRVKCVTSHDCQGKLILAYVHTSLQLQLGVQVIHPFVAYTIHAYLITGTSRLSVVWDTSHNVMKCHNMHQCLPVCIYGFCMLS